MLNVSDALTVSQALRAGNSESVTVSGEATSQINLQDATSAGLINSTQLNELVLVSRNYETLLNLQPGVSYGNTRPTSSHVVPSPLPAPPTRPAFSVNGGRSTSNNWTIDGADNLDRGANLTLYVYPSPDAIGQFKTLRGQYSAAVRPQFLRPGRRRHQVRHEQHPWHGVRVLPQ